MDYYLILSIILNCRNPTSNQQISSSERLTIHFYAVLSKDFKFNPKEDFICVRAGGPIGDLENDLTELVASRLVKFSSFHYSLLESAV